MPLTAKFFPEAEDPELFFNRPLVTTHTRINHVYPSLTALACLPMISSRTNSLVVLIRNACPLLRLLACAKVASCSLETNLFSNPLQNLCFSRAPSWLLAFNILNKEPAFLALQRRSAGYQVGYGLPVGVWEVLHEGVPLVSNIQYDVLKKHSLILLPLRVWLASLYGSSIRTIVWCHASLIIRCGSRSIDDIVWGHLLPP